MFDWTVNKTYKFVIHQHDAKKAGRHYDLRILRDDGNVESYATRKNPFNIKKGERRLLIRQPLHDKQWLYFQGEIEDGYGAGKLTIKDKGSVKVIKINDKYVILNFKGEKFKGRYVIIHIGRDNFLLLKPKSA